MVKNTVIVPVGSKGGRLRARRRRPPPDREAFMKPRASPATRTTCAGCSTSPTTASATLSRRRRTWCATTPTTLPRRRRRQGHGDLLRLRQRHQQGVRLWLGDAFASGGSVGYDHKAMGITRAAPGESVKRHFRELMAWTRSRPISPSPASATCRATCSATACCCRATSGSSPRSTTATSSSTRTRRRTQLRRAPAHVALPRSSWTDYDASLISAGGGIHARIGQVDRADA